MKKYDEQKECISAEIKPNIQNSKKKIEIPLKVFFFTNSSQLFKVNKRNLWICADFMHLFSKLSSTVCISKVGGLNLILMSVLLV